MSELAPGSVSLEEDASAQFTQEPTPEAPPAPEAPAETQQTAPPADDPEPEGTIVNPNGEKLVPLSALAAKRQEASTAKAALAERDAKIAALEQKAQKLDQIQGDWQRVQPLIQQLQSGQFPPPQAPAPAGPLSPQDAIDYAKDLDLYKADGSPDVDRAQRLAARQQSLAERSAQQAVQPLYQNNAQQQSAVNFQTALNFKDKNGVQIDKPTLERVWGMMPAEMSARPEIAGVLYKIAVAEMVQAGAYKTPTQAPPPPLITESLGGNGTAPRELSKLDRDIIAAGQIKVKDYESISSAFKPGQINALE